MFFFGGGPYYQKEFCASNMFKLKFRGDAVCEMF